MKALKLLIICLISANLKAQTFNLILVSDIRDVKFGVTSLSDEQLIPDLGKHAAKSLGKGFFTETQKSEFPFLALNDKALTPLNLDEVARLIDAKENAFGFVIADCRDARATGEERQWPIRIHEPFDKVICEKLFLQSCGTLKLSTSKKSQKTYTTPDDQSSAFTQDLIDFLSAENQKEFDEVFIERELISTSIKRTEDFTKVTAAEIHEIGIVKK